VVRRKNKSKRETLKEADRLKEELALTRSENEDLREKNSRLQNELGRIGPIKMSNYPLPEPTTNNVGRKGKKTEA